MKKRIFALLLSAMMLLSFVTVSAQEPATTATDEQVAMTYSNSMIKALIKSYAHDIADNYYYGIADSELLYAVICSAVDEGKVDVEKSVEAMIKVLGDDYAEYYTPAEYTALMEDVQGEFSGIGVVISLHEKGVFVSSVMENTPAKAAGIKDGDIITAVNGTPIAGLSVDSVRNLIVGATNTEVNVTVLRNEEEITFVCTRAKVEVSNIATDMLTDDIAYVRVLQFSQNTPQEVQTYVKDVQHKGVKKLVVDLRNNPGGDLGAAIEMSNIFISAGRIAELRYKDSSLNTFVKSENFHAPNIKLVVLVNEKSASASEFFSMAIQSRGAGEIIGTKTFGKGSMQAIKRLYTGGGIKYTAGEFYSIKGDRVHTVGITPDKIVENEIVKPNQDEFKEIDYARVEEGAKGGEMTLALEQRLNAIGYLAETPDEVFDENTAEAVKMLQLKLGYEATGTPGFYEYLYLNDLDYDFGVVIDKQLEAAIEFLS